MTPRHFETVYGPRPSALLFGDDCASTDDALEAVEAIGLSCRIVDRIESAHLALHGTFPDVLVLETAAAAEEELADLLARLIPYAAEADIPIIATASIDRLDLVSGYLWSANAQLLCEPTPEDRRAALEAAIASPACPILQDGAASRAREIESLRDDIERIASTVRALANDPPQAPAPDQATQASARVRAENVRKMIRDRRLRDRFFDGRLFADPAWDILLDLYAAHLEQRQVSVSSLCIAAATPPTTALRWISSMTDANILMRRPDGTDKRRHLISLSDAALHAIERYFVALHTARTI